MSQPETDMRPSTETNTVITGFPFRTSTSSPSEGLSRPVVRTDPYLRLILGTAEAVHQTTWASILEGIMKSPTNWPLKTPTINRLEVMHMLAVHQGLMQLCKNPDQNTLTSAQVTRKANPTIEYKGETPISSHVDELGISGAGDGTTFSVGVLVYADRAPEIHNSNAT